MGLDFILGRGLNASDVQWFGALLRSLQVEKILDLLKDELRSEYFQDCWGFDFSKSQLKDLYVALERQLADS